MKADRVHSGSDAEAPLLPTSSSHLPRKKPLTLLPLIAIIFFEVSGGPFGTEDAVAAAGPLLVLVGFIILPLVWSVPEALITAELATAFPENSGYVAWVTAAFGPFWGFQEGFWSWLSGVTDNSIYPVMLADNLRLFFPALNGGWPRMAFLLVVSLLLTYLNYRGLSVVGNFAMSTTLFIVAPFLLLCVLAVPVAQPGNWLKVDWSTVQWGTFLNIMFWNTNYWDSVSCLAGEVDNPSRTFPRALMWAVLLVVLSYFLPTLAALGVAVDTADWQLGYYGKVAQQVGGNWLAWWIVLAAAASQIGQFQAEMSSDSYQLQGMAERGFLPRALARRSRHGTPTFGILLSSAGVLCLGTFSFVDIVELLNAVYCLAELLEFAAFVALRIKAPLLPRPYRVPLPTWGLVAMLLPATALLLAVLILPMLEHNYTMMAATSGAIAAGFALYPLMGWAKEKAVVSFTDLQFDYAHNTGSGAAAAEARGGEVGEDSYTIHATGTLNYDPTYDAAYVDVVHDGTTRTTGSSMDLGSRPSSSRGPGSVTGSLGGFPSGTSPRSPMLASGRPAAARAVTRGAPVTGLSPPAAGTADGSTNGRQRPSRLAQQQGSLASAAAAGVSEAAAARPQGLAASKQLSSFRVRISEADDAHSSSDSEEATAAARGGPAPMPPVSAFAAAAGADVDSGVGAQVQH